ncbi:BTB/POZ domain-containing protein kctd12 [Balamuthia mandrillaris]
MLARMFSGLLPLRKRQSDGRVFIDRDGELFKFVLQFLRDGDLDVEDMDKHLVARLRREAAFFCLQELEQKLDTLQKEPEQQSQPTQGEEPEHIVAYLAMTTNSLNQVQINGRLLEYTPYFSELSKVVSQNAQYTIAALCNYFSKRGYKLVTSYSTAPAQKERTSLKQQHFLVVFK